MAIEIELPFKLTTPNVSHHWGKRLPARRTIKKALYEYLKLIGRHIDPPCRVTITRLAPKFLDDDNLTYCAKNLRDDIAAWLRPGFRPGMADGQDSGIVWEYKQHKSTKYAIHIKIVPIIVLPEEKIA